MLHLLGLLFFAFAEAQELPPIVQYLPETYGGDTQNWSISQSRNNYVYVANNQGLLEFNGNRWRLYPSPNETIIRSVHAVEDRIYTGCYMDFGFWERNDFGKLTYTSISEAIQTDLIEDEQFWHIVDVGHRIVFQSLNRLYVYDATARTLKAIKVSSPLLGIYKIKGTVYFQDTANGIFSIENGTPQLVVSLPEQMGTVINIFEIPNGIRLLTNKSGFYDHTDGALVPWRIEADSWLQKATLYSGLQLKNGGYMLGTIAQGLFYITSQGGVAYQINQAKGLSNNTVLSLFQDKDENIWAALDNGVNCLNINSPVQIFNNEQAAIGTTYAAALFEGNLYLGTNQGLFCKPMDGQDKFAFVKGTAGQVWSLFAYDDKLFCGHDSGSFWIEKSKANWITDLAGVWKFVPIPTKPDWLLQGTYSGISLLEKKKGKWGLKHRLEGFAYSSKFLEWYENRLWVNHEYKGMYNVTVNDDFSKVIQVTKDTLMPKKKNSSLIQHRNKLLFAHEDGVFYYDTSQDVFRRDSVLSGIYAHKGYVSGKIIEDRNGRLWGFSEQDIGYVDQDQFSDQLQRSAIAIPSNLRQGMTGYENITQLSSNLYLLGNSGGYLTLDLDKINTKPYAVLLDGVAIRQKEGSFSEVSLHARQSDIFDSNSNIISFEYTVPEYDKYLVSSFQYQLEGFYQGWSEWSSRGAVVFENLPYGSYTFKVRAKIGNELSKNVESYSFEIARPWYLSSAAVVVYVAFLLLALLLIHRLYKKYYTQQKLKLVRESAKQLELKSLESKSLIMKLKNEKLLQDIESKNRELAASTINIIKKNEILNAIKKELVNTKIEQKQAIKNVEKIIDRNLSNEDDWRYFEEAFNSVDKDFLKKLKAKHDNLTPHDLRFCTYLRLNLSSKEIAPLLNISVRSVEIKRYRLRKKLDLAHKESLVSYILDI